MYEPPGDEEPSGCLDTIVLTRAMLAVLFWPVMAMMGVLLVAAFGLVLYSIHPALVLIPIAIVGLVLYLFARWEQRHYPPPDA